MLSRHKFCINLSSLFSNTFRSFFWHTVHVLVCQFQAKLNSGFVSSLHSLWPLVKCVFHYHFCSWSFSCFSLESFFGIPWLILYQNILFLATSVLVQSWLRTQLPGVHLMYPSLHQKTACCMYFCFSAVVCLDGWIWSQMGICGRKSNDPFSLCHLKICQDNSAQGICTDSSLRLSWKIRYRGSPTHESLTGELTEMTADISDSCDDVSCCSVPRTLVH